MTAPTVYRWDDTSAPTLTGENTSLIALLQACLVDGYGSQSAAGWTKPYDDGSGTKAVFRNSSTTGSGMYLQVDNTVAANYGLCQAYESMTDVDTGVNPFIESYTGVYMYSSYNTGTEERPWILIADDRYFTLITWVDLAAASLISTARSFISTLFFGDGISLHASDSYFCILAGTTGAYYSRPYALGYSTSNSSSSAYHFAARPVSGASQEARCDLIYNGGPYETANTYGPGAFGIARVSGSEVFSRPYINDGAAYTLRGFLPGLWHPCHVYSDFTMLEEITVDTHTFLMIPFQSYTTTYNRVFAIDISTNFRP